MSSQTNKTIIDNLQLAYRAVLLQIVRSLEKDQQEQLRFYFKELIEMGDPRALSILSSLKNEGKISWTDVSFLKDGVRDQAKFDSPSRFLCKDEARKQGIKHSICS